MNTYTPVIGLEVHVELTTKSKMFCGCANDWFGARPNTHTCPVCLGLPGALPVPNKAAIEACIKIGMALNCHILLVSKFDRKNYFYPDLAKGYQISQYDQPFSENGYIVLSSGKKIGIRRAHMEEDTGKLMHETVDNEKVSLIDFNRSGVPLVEIVTEPDFTSAAEVKEYLQKLQQIVRYLGVASADMEKGQMRLEPNISLRPASSDSFLGLGEGEGQGEGFELPNYKVEVKNINSFSFVEKAIEYEVKRQAELLDRGERPAQETRGWDEDKKKTISQRSKEEAADYRYFPEPDIPPFVWTQDYIDSLKKDLPELPNERKDRFVKGYGLSDYNAELLTRTPEMANYFEECVAICHPELAMPAGRQVSGSHANVIPAQAGIQENGSPIRPFGSELRAELSGMTEGVRNDITPTQLANTIINKKVNIEKILPATLVKDIVEANKVSGISDEELMGVLNTIVEQNNKVVEDYKAGKLNALMFLVGQAMRELKGKAKADMVKATLEKLLS